MAEPVAQWLTSAGKGTFHPRQTLSINPVGEAKAMKKHQGGRAVAEFVEKLRTLGESCAFRGQGDSEWRLESGAVRRIVKEQGDAILHVEKLHKLVAVYQRDVLIDPAITRALDLDEHGRMSELELLAKLQHFGAATALLDFTWDPLVALWFACEEGDKDGKVFALNIGGTDGAPRLAKREEQKTVEEVFKQERGRGVVLWEPTMRGDSMLRILRQRSVFVIGPPIIPQELVREILIEKDRKAAIKQELSEFFDKGEDSLFMDVQGFAHANRWRNPISQLSDPSWYGGLGNKAYREGRYEDAVRHYTTAIELGLDEGHMYVRRGNARTDIKQFKDAESDFTEAINRRGRYGPYPIMNERWQIGAIYMNRGNVRYALGKAADAIEDYSIGIELAEGSGAYTQSMRFNRANAKVAVGLIEESLEDYEKCGGSEAIFNRANVLVRLGRFEEALAAYKQYSDARSERTVRAKVNARRTRQIMETVNGRTFNIEPGSNMIRIKVVSREKPSNRTKVTQVWLNGDTGNSGNIGPASFSGGPEHTAISGGQGFHGGSPIEIQIETPCT